MFYTLSILIWPLLYSTYSCIILSDKPATQKKLVTNSVSLTNCYSTVILGSLYYLTRNPVFYQTSYLVNGSYFIWDTYRIILSNVKSESIYVVHHIVALMLFNSMNYNCPGIEYQAYYLAEFSNIFMYIIYHFLKTKDQDDKNNLKILNKLLLIQLFCMDS